MAKKKVSVYLEDRAYEALRKETVRQRRSISAVVRRLVRIELMKNHRNYST